MTTQLTPPPVPTPRVPGEVTVYDQPEKKPWYKADYYIGRAIKLEELMNFTRQASAFLRAGVPILDSLAVVAEEGASKKMVEVLDDLQLRLRSGSTFGDALAQHPKVFPGYYVAIVRAAELTGKLDEALDQLAEYIDREVCRSEEVRSALTYPIIVFFLAITTLIVMAVYVLPKFSSLYTSLHARLPLPTRMLLSFTNFMSNWWWLVVLIVGGIVLVMGAIFGGQHGKARRDTALLKLPAIGNLLKLIAIERFCRGTRGVGIDGCAVARRSPSRRRQYEQQCVRREARNRS